MSVREVLALTKEYSSVANPEQFAFALVEHLLSIITELSDLCEKKNWDIKSIPTFDLRSNDWQIAMLQIYEQLYLKDCKKVKAHQDNVIRAGLHKEGSKLLRGLPASYQGFSKILKPFLMHLHGRRVRLMPVPNTKESRQMKGLPIPVVKLEREIADNELYLIENRLNAAHERIHDEVFGPEMKKAPIPEPQHPEMNKESAWSEDDQPTLQEPEPVAVVKEDYSLEHLKTLPSKSPGFDLSQIMPADMQGKNLKQKKSARKRGKQVPPSSEYIWPFKDSYVPNAKMLPQDAKLIKQSLKLNHFPKPHDKQQLTLEQLQERARAMQKIQGTYKIRVKNQVGRVVDWKSFDRKASTSSDFQETYNNLLRNSQLKSPNTLKLPLIVEDSQPGNLINQFDREQRIKDRKIPAKVQSGIKTGLHFTPVRKSALASSRETISSRDKIDKFLQDRLENSSIKLSPPSKPDIPEPTKQSPIQMIDHSQEETPQVNHATPVRMVVEQEVQIDEERLMPMQLLDYDPITNGFKFTLEAIQNLPENETSIFKVTAQINSYSFNIDEPNVDKSAGGHYCFDHQGQPVMYQKLSGNSCIVYFITKYDVVTGKTTNNYAFAIQPLIHVMKERQFLICGRYYLPLYRGFPPKELFDAKLQIRNTLKAMSDYLIPSQSLVVKIGDADDTSTFEGLPSFLHCLVDRRKFGAYEAHKHGVVSSLKQKLLDIDEGQGKWMGVVQKAKKSMLKA